MKKYSVLLLSALLFLLISVSGVSAQQYYTLLKKGDYEEYNEKPAFIPDVRIKGEFNILYVADREGILRDGQGFTVKNEFSLDFRSEVNRNISLNVKASNREYRKEDDGSSYYRNKALVDYGKEPANANQTIIAEEAFLEYNHNPSAVLRLGTQSFTVGNEWGLVYKGVQPAVTQGCTIGTWCYFIGASQLDPYDKGELNWGQLTYPVYENGRTVSNQWGERKEEALSIEIFRVFYTNHDVPLAIYGGNTWERKTEDVSVDNYQLKYLGKEVYNDIAEEYFGLNLNWLFKNTTFHFSYTQVNGSKDYHTGTADSTDDIVDLGDRSVFGSAFFLRLNHYMEEHRIGIEGLYTTGNDPLETGENPWGQGTDEGYYEINRGTFGDARIYFSGYNHTGQGHSANNVTYYSAFYGARSSDSSFEFDAKLYQFNRTVPVYNDKQEKVSLIGTELDISFNWYLQKKLNIGLLIDIFEPGEAYAPDDSITPTGSYEGFSKVSLLANYKF